jgi:uroporphyrinogen-III synthase
MNKGQPLIGKRVVITRSPNQAQEFIHSIEELGGKAIPCPVIKTVLPDNLDKLDWGLRNLSSYDWIIFTSVNAVRFFLQRGKEIGISVQEQLKGKVAAVGTKTAVALRKQNIKVDHIPAKFTADDLLESLKDELVAGQKVLIPHANLAKKNLANGLENLGLFVDDIVTYETIADDSCKEEVRHLLENSQADVITFTSPSTVHNFLALLDGLNWEEFLHSVTIAVIGPVTAEAAKQLGLKVDVIAKEYSIPGLIQELVRHVGSE